MKKATILLVFTMFSLIVLSCKKSKDNNNQNNNVNNPTVTTTAVSSITTTSAVSGGNITSGGSSAVTARGVCWSASANPSITDSHTTDGTGTGNFISNITGLSGNTAYHVRAYATNGSGTSYGSDVTYSTGTPATITYHNNGLTPISIRHNGDTLNVPIGGNVTFDGMLGGSANGSAYAAIQLSTSVTGSYFYLAISDTFNNQTRNIDVDNSIYLLQLVNNTGYVITDIEYIISTTSGGGSDHTFHIDHGIPSDGLTYKIGYFLGCGGLGYSYEIKLLHNDPFDFHYWTYNNIQSSLPCTNNQSYTLHAP